MFKSVIFVILSSLSIVGAVVGVGFVSGREIVSFFFNYEPFSLLLAFVQFVLLFVVIYFTIKVKSGNLNENKKRNNEYIKLKNNVKTYKTIKNNINLFEKFYNIVIGFMSILVVATMLGGLESVLSVVIKSNIVVIFIKLFVVVFIGVYIVKNGSSLVLFSGIMTGILIVLVLINLIVNFKINESAFLINFRNINFSFFGAGLISVVFYVSMNMLSCEGVINNISYEVKNKKQIMFISLFSSFLLSFLLIFVLLVYKSYLFIVKNEMPLLNLSSNLGVGFYYLYLSALFFGCFMTIVSVAYSGSVCFSRVFDFKHIYYGIGFMFISFLISIFGFEFLVEKMYPLIGFVYLFLSVFRIAFVVIKNAKNKN